MDSLTLQKEFTANFNISLCRAAIRKTWHFLGVRNEINENCFELKNIGIRQGLVVGFSQSVTAILTDKTIEFSQCVTILLTEKDESTTIIQIQTTPFATVNNNQSVWQTKMEELVGIMWRELYQALETPYKPAAYNPIQNTNTESVKQPSKNKKIWIGIAVVAVAVILAIVYLPQLFGGDNKTYKYSSQTGVVIEMTLDGGYDRGSYSLKVYNPNVYGRDNTYTGKYWTNGTTVNSYENFAITGYVFAQFYISSDRSKLIIDCYTGSGSLYITYTLSLQ
ncbi:MAG: hypothetical protein WC292_01445 [Clostridia bacterium]